MMLKSSLCDYNDAYILLKGTIIITGDAGPEPQPLAAARALAKKGSSKTIKEIKEQYLKTVHYLLIAQAKKKNMEIDNA